MPRVSASERVETRTRLIDAGKREFAERGLAGARFDEISLAAGYAKGTIYNYFDGKEDLFFTIVNEWCTRLVDAFQPPPDAGAAEALRHVTQLDVAIAANDPELARVVVQHIAALEHTHRVAVDAAIGPGLDLLERILIVGAEQGELRFAHRPRTVARLFLGVLSAFELEALAPDSDLSLNQVVQLIDDHFTAALRTGATATQEITT